jgi:hypothetical protein
MLQIILSAIAIGFLFNGIKKFINKERSQSFLKFSLTVIVWTGILFAAMFPNDVHIFTERLGLGQNLNTLIFIVFVLVFMIIYRLLATIEKIEQNISEIVRKEALSKLKIRN